MSIGHLLNKTVTHQRASKTSDGQGGWVEGYANLNPSTIRVRFNNMNAKDIEQAGLEIGRAYHRAYTDPSADIRLNDKLIDGSRIFLVVIPVHKPSIEIYNRIIVEEWQGESS